MSIPTLTRRDVFAALTNERGRPLVPVSWTFEYLDALDDSSVLELILWVMRQSGKTTHIYAGAISTLLTRPGSYIGIVGASEGQTEATFARKLRRPLERLARELGIESAIKWTRGSVEIPDLESALELFATNATTAPARTLDELYIDEARDVATVVYEVLAPSVIGASGKSVIASTAGAPKGFFYDLIQNPTEHTKLIHPATNENPDAHSGVRDFLGRRFSLLFPQAARRELMNEFTEDGEALIPWAVIEACIDDTLTEKSESNHPVFAGGDLSLRRDLTSLAVVERVDPRQPEAADHLKVCSLQTWDPKASPTREVDFSLVRAALDAMPRRFPRLKALLIDAGAESSSVLPWCRQHHRLSLLTQPFTATADSNMEIWSGLAARLNAGTISIPRHERLLSELRGLRMESFSFGSKWRVVDASRRFHRDVSLALALAVHAAGGPESVPQGVLFTGAGSPDELAALDAEIAALEAALRGRR